MCGIAGIITPNGSPDCLALQCMTDKIMHRGPDGEGHLLEGNYAFGHRRLSIVDLSDAGHQPMVYRERYVITYNGEVYNHNEIRSELEAVGYCFNGHSDTEVILASYDRWGADCLRRFNGMWAFAIYDRQQKTFFIARDRFGVKPLYYFQDENSFIFASEMKAILAHPSVKKIVDEDYLNRYLDRGPLEFLPETVFKNIYKFPKAAYCIMTAEQALAPLQSQIFWSITPNLSSEVFNEKKAQKYAEEYYALLEDAVRIRMKADVKVGSALSGGLDSSSIVFLVNKILREEGKDQLQETFSAVFSQEGTRYCDESNFIQRVVDQLQVKANWGEVAEEEVPHLHQRVIESYESPPDNSCVAGSMVFRTVAKTDVKVTLDGQGADEQLAGYLGYFNSYLVSLGYFDFWRQAPHVLQVPKAWKHVLAAFFLQHVRLLCGMKGLVLFLRCLGIHYEPNLNQRLKNDFDTALVNLLHYADRVSMMYSIESRAPFMDYRLVEFLSSMPATYKIHNGWTKYIARLAFDGKLPDEICWRKDKLGWPSPDDFWFRKSSLRNWFIGRIEGSFLVKKLRPALNVEKELDKRKIVKMIRYLNVAVFDKLHG